jgi:hypothetical protein
MKRKITRFARAGKCGARGANGLESASARSASIAWRAMEPKPQAVARRKLRRDEGAEKKEGLFIGEKGIHWK